MSNYQFDDNKLFPKAVNLAIDLDGAINDLYTKVYFGDKVEVSKEEIKGIQQMSADLHEIMRRLEEQSAFPKK